MNAESMGTLPAAHGSFVPSGLDVPAVAAPSFSTVQREMPGAANCWISTSSPTRWRRPVQGHLVDCCWKGIPFAAVIAANQPLCQLNAERLQVHSRPAPSWPALPYQDEGVGMLSGQGTSCVLPSLPFLRTVVVAVGDVLVAMVNTTLVSHHAVTDRFSHWRNRKSPLWRSAE